MSFHPDENAPSRSLDIVQRWFQAVVSHPAGPNSGIESADAQQLIPMSRDQIEQVIGRSSRLSAIERIGVYANAYYARLLDCLRESFPVLHRATGAEVFDGFAMEYLQRYPSTSYTLGLLGAHFVEFLSETRPDRPADGSTPPVSWPDFLIDLARLEWEIEQVFDGPGTERETPFDAKKLSGLAPASWQTARLRIAPCVRLLRFSYPVNDYFTQARAAAEGEEIPMPEPAPQWLALTRREYVVRRHVVSQAECELLGRLLAGDTLLESIEHAGAFSEASDDELAASIHQWFAEWTNAGMICRIDLAKP